MKSLTSAIAAAMLALTGGAAAQAPTLGSAAQGNAPLDISAEGATYDGAACVNTWVGNVEVINGSDRLRSPRLEVHYPRLTGAAAGQQRCGAQVERIEASGPVYYVTPTQNARGDHGTFIGSSDTIILTGNVVLIEGRNVLTGARATINTRTRDARIEAGPSTQSNGRVRAVIFPNQTPAGQRPAARPTR